MKKYFICVALIIWGASISACSQVEVQKMESVKNIESEKIVTDQDAVKNALNVGSKIPSFSLKDSNGKTVNSDDLLKHGNLVIVFYRGEWCPYCNLQLRNLQKNAEKIWEAGGNIVAISVANPDTSLSVSQKNELKFPVLSDPQLATARKFGIVFQFSKETDETYKNSYNLDIAKINEMDKPELPLASTFIVNQKGEIVYAYLDTDYEKRAEPEEIIGNLKKIKN